MQNHNYLMRVISNLMVRINSYSGTYSERDNVEIDYFAFFILCDSMKDYIVKSSLLDKDLCSAIYDEIHENNQMKLCNAIANLEKHFQYNGKQDKAGKIKIVPPGIQPHHIINRHLSTTEVLVSPVSDTDDDDDGELDIIDGKPYYEEIYHCTVTDVDGKIYDVKALANDCFCFLCSIFTKHDLYNLE